MATRADYRTLIQNEVDDTSTAGENVINNIIREIYQEVVRVCNPYISSDTSETATATAGTGTFTPTNTFSHIRKVLYKQASSDDYMDLSPIGREDYFDNHINDSNGVPMYYHIDGANVVVSPPPADAGTLMIDGSIQVDELDDDVTVSLVPDDFSRVIVLGSVGRFLAYEKDPAATEYMAMYAQAKADMLGQLATKGETVRPKLY